MPFEALKDYVGAIVGLFTALVAAIWIVIGMIFSARSEARRAHTRIDRLEQQVAEELRNLREELKHSEALATTRDVRIEDKLDRLIESGVGWRGR